MIKVNLAKLSDDEHSSVGLAEGLASFGGGDSSHGIKLLIILTLPLMIYFWDQHASSHQKTLLRKKNDELSEIQQEIKKFGAVSSVVEGFQAEKKDLEKKLETIKKISLKRVVKLKVLTELQIILPGDCWIREIEFKKQQLTLEGNTFSPSSVQTLAEEFEKLDFVAQAIPENIKRDEKSKNAESPTHTFTINATLRL